MRLSRHVILSRADGEGSRATHSEILRFAQDDVVRILVFVFLCTFSLALSAQQIHVNRDTPFLTDAIPFTISGTTDAAAGTTVTMAIESQQATGVVGANGAWMVAWTTPLQTGTYEATVTIGNASTTQFVRVQLPGLVQRQWPVEPELQFGPIEMLSDAFLTMTDRWRIAPPPYELDENSRGRKIGTHGASTDPYNRNLFKGDIPIRGTDTFLVLTGVSDTLFESRTLPTPSGVSAQKPGSIHFFGKDEQSTIQQNVDLSFDLFQGDTAFQPVKQRLKATLIWNFNHLRVEENAIVKPDVRRGTRRDNGFLSLQEIFYERKLRDLSPNYDFLSIRAGSQPFNSDFRGFIFTDTNLGVRVFGNYASNRYQYNAAIFDRREKDTNSGLNTLTERRGQQVGVANLYIQDFFRKGYTQEFSLHALHDEGDFKYDRNGILVRPAPIGVFTPHTINAVYFGQAGLGHFGRINVDHALYYVVGRDTLNPLAGPDPKLKDGNSTRIGAGMAALEVSYDHDWFRPRAAIFFATGDRSPRDRHASGFDAIYDAPAFAGGGFSFFNRLGIKLAGSGVALVERGSLLPDLRTSKDEGQPNFVNPGVQLLSAGVDVDVTPRMKALFNANYIRLDTTKPIEALLFQGDVHRTLGSDLSIGIRYRPFLNQNVVIVGGAAAFLPGAGFEDIYESKRTLYHAFFGAVLTF
jgi:hypothetical protein